MDKLKRPPMPPPPLLLRPIEAAWLLNFSVARVYQLIRSGELPSVRVGGSLRVPRADLEGWLRERTRTQPAAKVEG